MAGLSLSTVPVVATVTIDGRDYAVRPFSIGRSLGLREHLDILQQQRNPAEGTPEDAERWLDSATAFICACVPDMSPAIIEGLDGESFAALFGFVADEISKHDKGRREELAAPLSGAPSE